MIRQNKQRHNYMREVWHLNTHCTEVRENRARETLAFLRKHQGPLAFDGSRAKMNAGQVRVRLRTAWPQAAIGLQTALAAGASGSNHGLQSDVTCGSFPGEG